MLDLLNNDNDDLLGERIDQLFLTAKDLFETIKDEFSEEDNQKFMESDEFLGEGVGTPLLMNVGNEKIIDKVDGLTDSAHYIQFFKDNGYIK